jgi:hypothetical protein
VVLVNIWHIFSPLAPEGFQQNPLSHSLQSPVGASQEAVDPVTSFPEFNTSFQLTVLYEHCPETPEK